MTAPLRVRLSVVPEQPAPPPYAADVRAKGWRFELDHERIEQSDTWALAPPELRPWLLMLWMVAWRQSPCGSLPDSDEIIAARIGMAGIQFAAHRAVLMRGWVKHGDGRLYHQTITEQVIGMLEHRTKETSRKHTWTTKTQRIRERDGGACVYCGATTYLSLDHLIPISRGGGGEDDNLVTACRGCNSSKRDRTPDEARMGFVNERAAEQWVGIRNQALALFGTRSERGRNADVTTPEPEPEPEPEEKLSPPTGGEGAASTPQHPADTDAEQLEHETETAARLPACPIAQILDLYHEQLPQLPRCLTLTDARRGYIRTRWREIGTKRKWATRAEGLDFFRRYFEFVGKSKFLTGRESGRDGKPPFEADLEWLMRPGNFAKVVEGKFHR